MMNDKATAAVLQAEIEGGFSGCGSPGRLAALQLLGTAPLGVRSDALRHAIRAADPRVWDEGRMQNVLSALRTAGLVAVERDERGTFWWFSPGARHVALLRGTWPPPDMGARHPARRTHERVAELAPDRKQHLTGATA